MITIKDIAQAAECSLSTVSKAINGRDDISASTRARILKIVEELDYTPNAFGKGLKNKKTENIGVIFSRESRPLSLNPFYSRVLEGIEAELAINDYNLVLHMLPEKYDGEYPKMLKEHNVDGIILFSALHDRLIQQLLDDMIPMVHVDPGVNSDRCSQVIIDNERGAFLATQYLIHNGHKKIAFISPDIDRESFRLRYLGFRRAMDHYRLKMDERYIRIGGLEQGYEQVRDLVQLKKRPTAIFITNDLNVMYAYQAIKDCNLTLPDDISIIGFDDISWAKSATPSLTTIRVYKEEMGSIAVRMLLRIINNELNSPVTTMIPVRLVERKSVKNLSQPDGT